ncbi:MAG: hypothetical protein ABF289_05875, partial [Clostridiales bacterium]
MFLRVKSLKSILVVIVIIVITVTISASYLFACRGKWEKNDSKKNNYSDNYKEGNDYDNKNNYNEEDSV